jgi:recombination protein RecA
MAATASLLALTPPLTDGFSLPSSLGAVLPVLPRGAITEIVGGASSGRTALLHQMLAAATAAGELASVVDSANAFDPAGVHALGGDLGKLLWVRCGGRAEHALRAADLILHGGGFGMVALDLCDVPERILQHVPTSYWHRFRRAIENTPTVLAVAASQPQARSCAARQIAFARRRIRWTGREPARLLSALETDAHLRKPPALRAVTLEAAA